MTRHYPGGTGTFSKAPSQWPSNAPRFATSGFGAHLYTSDGDFIDWTAALGAMSLGYGDPDVARATRLAEQNGNIFGLPHRLEWQYADELAEILPWDGESAVKYGKHGSDVTVAATRAARHITGRKRVLSHGYHGWSDQFCPNAAGTVGSRWTVPWDGIEIPANLDDYAAVIIEPEAFSAGALADLRQLTKQSRTLLIFDEVLSGFRTPKWTVAQWVGVIPDYLCLAKAIGNGWPISVVAGPQDLMEPFAGAIGYSFTFGGECVSLAAAQAVLRKYQREPVINRLWHIGAQIKFAWGVAEERTGLSMPLGGNPSRLVVKYPTLAHRTLFSQEMVRRGVLWSVGATPMYAHTDMDVERTIAAINESFDVVASVRDDPMRLVNGPAVSLPFRQMVTA